MSEVYSVRIPKRLKAALEEMRDVNWQDELRSFLEDRVREEYVRRQLDLAKSLRAQMKASVESADVIREDRDADHAR